MENNSGSINYSVQKERKERVNRVMEKLYEAKIVTKNKPFIHAMYQNYHNNFCRKFANKFEAEVTQKIKSRIMNHSISEIKHKSQMSQNSMMMIPHQLILLGQDPQPQLVTSEIKRIGVSSQLKQQSLPKQMMKKKGLIAEIHINLQEKKQIKFGSQSELKTKADLQKNLEKNNQKKLPQMHVSIKKQSFQQKKEEQVYEKLIDKIQKRKNQIIQEKQKQRRALEMERQRLLLQVILDEQKLRLKKELEGELTEVKISAKKDSEDEYEQVQDNTESYYNVTNSYPSRQKQIDHPQPIVTKSQIQTPNKQKQSIKNQIKSHIVTTRTTKIQSLPQQTRILIQVQEAKVPQKELEEPVLVGQKIIANKNDHQDKVGQSKQGIKQQIKQEVKQQSKQQNITEIFEGKPINNSCIEEQKNIKQQLQANVNQNILIEQPIQIQNLVQQNPLSINKSNQNIAINNIVLPQQINASSQQSKRQQIVREQIDKAQVQYSKLQFIDQNESNQNEKPPQNILSKHEIISNFSQDHNISKEPISQDFPIQSHHKANQKILQNIDHSNTQDKPIGLQQKIDQIFSTFSNFMDLEPSRCDKCEQLKKIRQALSLQVEILTLKNEKFLKQNEQILQKSKKNTISSEIKIIDLQKELKVLKQKLQNEQFYLVNPGGKDLKRQNSQKLVSQASEQKRNKKNYNSDEQSMKNSSQKQENFHQSVESKSAKNSSDQQS